MKKRLEADLISIAHRILQLKNKSDINQLFLETQKLYEKLAVLRFVDDHFADVKPTIGYAKMESKVEKVFDTAELTQSETKKAIEEIVETPLKQVEEIVSADEKSVAETSVVSNELETELVFESAEEIQTEIQNTPETIQDSAEFETKPVFELTDESQIETPNKSEAVQISFEDLLGGNYNEPMFVKVQPNEKATKVVEASTEIDAQEKETVVIDKLTPENVEKKAVPLNEKLAKGIHIDLNDRIAFVNHLFGGNNEDYNRVLNQLITFDTYPETREFIEEMVKPDYNNWDGKDDYAQRFIEIIEKKFLSF